jgi:hypothetical protein
MENSTNIIDLPTDPTNGGNVTINATEHVPSLSTTSNNSSSNSMMLDQTTINQIVSGLQQASASGATQLMSRDIPMTTTNLTQDPEIRANYIPNLPQTNDYINYDGNNPHEMIDRYNNRIERNNQLDDLYKEIQIPLLLAVLYFLFQLPIFKKYLFSFFPILFTNDGNFNINGYLFTSILFSIFYYLLNKINNHFDSDSGLT